MTQCPTFSLKTGLHISVQCTPHVLHRMGLPEADAVAWQCSCTQNAIEPSNLYKIMYDCSCLTRWHAHGFTYINPIIRRVSRMTLINQRHNKDRIRLRKYTSHIEVCNENNIPQWTCPVVHRTWPPHHSTKEVYKLWLKDSTLTIHHLYLSTLQQLLYILCTHSKGTLPHSIFGYG